MYQRTTFLNIAWHFCCSFDCHSIALLALSYGYAYATQVQVAMFYSIAQAYASPPTAATTYFFAKYQEHFLIQQNGQTNLFSIFLADI